MAIDVIKQIKMEAHIPSLLRSEKNLQEITRLMAKALHIGKPVFIGTIFGKDCFVTTNGVQKDNALGRE